MQGVFIGHLDLYNKNQIRDKGETNNLESYRRYSNERLDGF